MVHSRGLVLFILLLPGAARRSIHTGEAAHDSQHQTNTLTKALKVSGDAREASIPGGASRQFEPASAVHAINGQGRRLRAPAFRRLSGFATSMIGQSDQRVEHLEAAAGDNAPETQQGKAVGSEDREVLWHHWLLLRHGQTDSNAGGIIQGSSNESRLSDAGKQQSQAVGKFLGNLQIDYVYVSPLFRALETVQLAEEMAGKPFAEIKVVDGLRETDMHEWEGLCKKELKQTWPDIYQKYRGDNPADFRLPSGKYPIRDLWKRAIGVWQQLHAEASEDVGVEPLQGKKTALLSAHNGVNQALFGTALGLSEDVYRNYEFPNCGVIELVFNPGEDKARRWRWVYPSRTEWKTVEETKVDLSNMLSEKFDLT